MNDEQRSAYVAYRFETARETLEEARTLHEAGRYRGAVNRVYYAMFYAVGALALQRGFSTSSHGQLRGYFNREFVKSGLVDVSLGKAYGVAFDSRTKGDYDDLVVFEQEQVKALLADAEAFVETVATFVKPPQATD